MKRLEKRNRVRSKWCCYVSKHFDLFMKRLSPFFSRNIFLLHSFFVHGNERLFLRNELRLRQMFFRFRMFVEWVHPFVCLHRRHDSRRCVCVCVCVSVLEGRWLILPLSIVYDPTAKRQFAHLMPCHHRNNPNDGWWTLSGRNMFLFRCVQYAPFNSPAQWNEPTAMYFMRTPMIGFVFTGNVYCSSKLCRWLTN